ncbi:MAG: periplasmic heavy metal sensor [Acidobacteriota bacterium]
MDRIINNRWQVRVAAVAIFLLGFVAGALTLNLYHTDPSTAASKRGHHRFERLISRLNLTPDQKVKVEAILRDARAQFREVHKSSQPKFDEVRAQVHARLQEVLNPEQWQQFQQMMEKRREHFRRSENERAGEH